MATLNPYLFFEGRCGEAMRFYAECLGGELTIQTVGESAMASSMPKEMQASVMHAKLEAGSLRIMASDMLDGEKMVQGNATNLILLCDSEEEIRTLYGKLSAGGKADSPVKKEFWGAFYGDLTDKFGVRWMLNFDEPQA
ncbi:MAG TPA: VOC family protein [Treponema sp.]|nr:MAG: glyoxalase [Treponema sp. GWC1_61_84]OHE76588.1 MAG: glyoxalase [Treponema sp. RIFOXYC1_FULL_61_9]HCM27442.1 VOC family protein [Treponema sp.]